ncbi:MAG: AmmeMemoRadiSam system protein B [Gammaproteobacteria bacterium]|nr:AmmeMemoRadiSam system protein B [Gammaproteobacteria bacterium]MBU1558619.1 AmmeMemoRadiSam system protein B [Gammaproteobacteria bacterium]MBU1629347.1 AmmeMemoRadiSam system protein B [Gammaproteobacteria bacterium]MBU1926626.1 AmmeMemoRadiSam system protein B [Gammaproteobacteria bacterium]MBU2545807.1 AmmeMemoRadiSam system protein B [Gammaproteobacteria bacterium]
MVHIRQPHVAGLFYPETVEELTDQIRFFLEKLNIDSHTSIPKAIIAPHAGYVYSGAIAAAAYACLQNSKGKIKNVVIVAPAHRYPFQGIAVVDDDFFATPLGEIPVNQKAVSKILNHPHVQLLDAAFEGEHAIEVHLPLLQSFLNNFSLTPLLVGQENPDQVADVLEQLWGGSETLVVISSDLSHYLSYDAAIALDQQTIAAILTLAPEKIGVDQACGRIGIQALLQLARRKKLQPTLIAAQNSGDVIGDKEHVVGYAAFHFYESR